MNTTVQAFVGLGSYFFALFFVGMFWARKEGRRAAYSPHLPGSAHVPSIYLRDDSVMHTEVEIDEVRVAHELSR